MGHLPHELIGDVVMIGQPSTTAPDIPPARPQDHGPTGTAELVLEDRFSMIPEWVVDADIGDCALRLYAVLLRYGNSTGARMPSRTALARRLHKKSVDTVDRALAELVQLGAVQVEHRWAGQQRLTNRYRIRTARPSTRAPAAAPGPGLNPRGGRTHAATPVDRCRGGRIDAATSGDRGRGGRTSRGRVAARIGHDREPSTETPPPPPPPEATRPARPDGTRGGGGGAQARRPPDNRAAGNSTTEQWRRRRKDLLADCGIISADAWDGVVARVHAARHAAGQPLTRWSAAHLLTAVDLATRGRGWPADRAANALLRVAADPATRSPARLAEAGPWWDEPPIAGPNESVDVSALEAELDAIGGLRVELQRTAREQLSAEGRPVVRSTVISRAVELLHEHGR